MVDEVNKEKKMNLRSGESNIGDDNLNTTNNTKPIADLFPDCTVFFADIVNFTSWSSVYVLM